MKIVKEAVYASIFGAGVCPGSCGKKNNLDGFSSETIGDGISTEMDLVVFRDTIMPAS